MSRDAPGGKELNTGLARPSKATLPFDHSYVNMGHLWWSTQNRILHVNVELLPNLTLDTSYVQWGCLLADQKNLPPLLPLAVGASSFTKPANPILRAVAISASVYICTRLSKRSYCKQLSQAHRETVAA